jgi:type IV secretion system protein VirB3
LTGLESDRLFVALTRPQMFAGVTYSFFVLNAIVATEAFLIFRSFGALLLAGGLHLIAMAACLHEPRILDLAIVRLSRCPRVKNHRIWRCNSYRA